MRHLFALLLLVSSLSADVTLRYKTEIKPNPALPAALAQQITKSAAAEDVTQLKGGKAYRKEGPLATITDFTKKAVTVVDPGNRRFATLPANRFAEDFARATAKAKSGVGELADVNTVVESKTSGRTAEISSIQAEEHEVVFSVSTSGEKDLPAGPFMRIVIHGWFAKAGEDKRNPALKELARYDLSKYPNLAGGEMFEKALGQMQGLGQGLAALIKELPDSTLLRMQMQIFMPVLANLPAGKNPAPGFDPNASLADVTVELADLSTAPIPDTVFQVPASYTAAPPDELIAALAGQEAPKTAPTAYPPGSEESEVLKVEEAFRVAKLANDTAALAGILVDDYVGVNEHGGHRNKQQFLELYRTYRPDRVTPAEAEVKISGGIAIVFGAQIQIDGTEEHLQFVRVYVKREGCWQLLSSAQLIPSDPN